MTALRMGVLLPDALVKKSAKTRHNNSEGENNGVLPESKEEVPMSNSTSTQVAIKSIAPVIQPGQPIPTDPAAPAPQADAPQAPALGPEQYAQQVAQLQAQLQAAHAAMQNRTQQVVSLSEVLNAGISVRSAPATWQERGMEAATIAGGVAGGIGLAAGIWYGANAIIGLVSGSSAS